MVNNEKFTDNLKQAKDFLSQDIKIIFENDSDD